MQFESEWKSELSDEMHKTRGIGDQRMNVALNGELLEKMKCFEYSSSKITDGGIEI